MILAVLGDKFYSGSTTIRRVLVMKIMHSSNVGVHLVYWNLSRVQDERPLRGTNLIILQAVVG